MKRLSKVQQDVLDKMRNGWELGIYEGISRGDDGNCRIQQGGLGRGGKAQSVSWATVKALLNMGLVNYGEKKFPLQRMVLVQPDEVER